MHNLTDDISSIRSGLRPILNELLSGNHPKLPATDTETSPEMLAAAFEQMLEVMQRVESDFQAMPVESATLSAEKRLQHPMLADGNDVTELGEYAFRLLENLGVWLDRLGTPDRHRLAELTLAFALWVSRHDGSIATLEPAVDALSLLANSTKEIPELKVLGSAMEEITKSVSAFISQDLEKANPGRPWRILILNQGIIATRTHDPELMEKAFEVLIEKLPEDAPQFFSEGMQQMEALDYPAQVRAVVERYHKQCGIRQSLH